MGNLIKRPTYTQDITGLSPAMPAQTIPANTVTGPSPVPGAPPIDLSSPEYTLRAATPAQPTTRTEQFKGPNPLLSLIADFATGFGGPHGFGSGIPIEQQNIEQRRMAPQQFFEQKQQAEDVKTQRTMQAEKMNEPLIDINHDTGLITLVNPQMFKAGDFAGAIRQYNPSKMTSEDTHALLTDLQKEYDVKFSPEEALAVVSAAHNPQKLSAVVMQIKQQKQKEAVDAETKRHNQVMEQRKSLLLTPEEEAQKKRLEKSTGTDTPGTWALVEDDNGKTVMFNSKTGQTKAAPAGVHAKSELTSATRTMHEAAPQVEKFVARINPLIDKIAGQLGPGAGRWNEFMAGKVGASNPEFTKLRTDVGLLTTLLMRMHVGARGGEYIMKHFQDLIDSGKQSPENLKAALQEVDNYAKELQQEGKGAPGAGGGNAPPRGQATHVWTAQGLQPAK